MPLIAPCRRPTQRAQHGAEDRYVDDGARANNLEALSAASRVNWPQRWCAAPAAAGRRRSRSAARVDGCGENVRARRNRLPARGTRRFPALGALPGRTRRDHGVGRCEERQPSAAGSSRTAAPRRQDSRRRPRVRPVVRDAGARWSRGSSGVEDPSPRWPASITNRRRLSGPGPHKRKRAGDEHPPERGVC